MITHPKISGTPIQLGDIVAMKDAVFYEEDGPYIGVVTDIHVRCYGRHEMEDVKGMDFKVIGQREMEQVWIFLDGHGVIFEEDRLDRFASSEEHQAFLTRVAARETARQAKVDGENARHVQVYEGMEQDEPSASDPEPGSTTGSGSTTPVGANAPGVSCQVPRLSITTATRCPT